MSKWATATPKERESAPADVFCGPARSFPVADAGDVRRAAARLNTTNHDTGPIRACIIRKAKANGWTDALPDTWKANMSGDDAVASASGDAAQIAAFDLDGDGIADEEWVTRTGKVFEAGRYEDKDFEADPEDLYLAALDFTPVPNDIEHRPSILDGKIGELTAVELADDGASLVGTVRIPRWLHDTIGEAPIKTSLAWDRTTKRIVGNGLVLNPRVPDAALMGAYAEFTSKRHSASDQHHLNQAVDHLVQAGAEVSGLGPDQPVGKPKENATMSATPEQGTTEPTRFQRFMAWLSGEGADDATFAESGAPATPKTQAPPPAQMSAETTAQLNAAYAEIERLREKDIRRDAVQWVDSEIAARRLLPAQRDTYIAEFVQCVHDDADRPDVVQFDNLPASRLERLKARIAAQEPHKLTQEMLKDADLTALFNDRTAERNAANNGITPERREKLLKATPAGAAILNGK